MEREQQVLDRGPAGEEEHLALGPGALRIGVRVRAVEAHPRHDQHRRRAEHRVAAGQSPLDRRLGRAVAEQIRPPRLGDRAEQAALRRRRPQRGERPRPRVMRRGCRARRTHRFFHGLARDLGLAERADRPPRRDRHQRRLAEQVLLGRADDRGRGRGRRVRGTTPRTRAAGTRGRLRHHQPARGGDLVGERDDGGLEHRGRGDPVVPRRSTQAGSPAQPIATFTSPSRHGRPNVSVTTTPRSAPEALARAPPGVVSAEPSGSSGSSVSKPSATFEASTPAFAQTNPWRVSAITRSPRRATTRRVSRSTQAARPPSASGARRAPPPSRPPSGSRRPHRRPERRAPRAVVRAGRPRSSPGADLGQALDGDDLDRHGVLTRRGRARTARAPPPRRRRA